MKRSIVISISVGAVSYFLITLFLKGNMLHIEYGTHEGGIICAIGVAAILVIMISIISLIAIIQKKR